VSLAQSYFSDMYPGMRVSFHYHISNSQQVTLTRGSPTMAASSGESSHGSM